jgi:hypothetical protein
MAARRLKRKRDESISLCRLSQAEMNIILQINTIAITAF